MLKFHDFSEIFQQLLLRFPEAAAAGDGRDGGGGDGRAGPVSLAPTVGATVVSGGGWGFCRERESRREREKRTGEREREMRENNQTF